MLNERDEMVADMMFLAADAYDELMAHAYDAPEDAEITEEDWLEDWLTYEHDMEEMEKARDRAVYANEIAAKMLASINWVEWNERDIATVVEAARVILEG